MIKTAKAHNHMLMLRRENLSSLALLQLHACSLNHELKIFSLILLFLEKSSANQFQCSTTISKKKKKKYSVFYIFLIFSHCNFQFLSKQTFPYQLSNGFFSYVLFPPASD